MRLTNQIDVSSPISDHPLNLGLSAWYSGLVPGYRGRAGWKSLTRQVAPATFPAGREPSWRTQPGGGLTLNFDGTDDYCNLGDQAAFEFASGQSFTIAFGFTPATTGAGTGVFTKGYDGEFFINDVPWFLFYWNSSTIASWIRSAGSADATVTSGTLTIARHRVLASYDAVAATWTQYIDGAVNGTPVGSVAASAYGTNGSPAILGQFAGADYAGRIDDVKVWKGRAFTAPAARADYWDWRANFPLCLRRVRQPVYVQPGEPPAPPAAVFLPAFMPGF